MLQVPGIHHLQVKLMMTGIMLLISSQKKRINPLKFISHRFDTENFEKGLKIMRDKSEDYIVKIMMIAD